MTRGVFVTGTDTGVGKTLAACALLHALAARGVRARGMKPIAAGATDGVNEDTAALLRAGGGNPHEVTPLLLRAAMAPHIAAEREGVRLALAPVADAFARLQAQAEFLVVEGVGGFKVPLAPGLDTVDMARMLGLPVVMVVGLRLGCLNHALLTADAIAAAGLPFAGWIANAVDPAMEARDENVAALAARLGAPLLGRIPWQARPDAAALARHLDVGPLP